MPKIGDISDFGGLKSTFLSISVYLLITFFFKLYMMAGTAKWF